MDDGKWFVDANLKDKAAAALAAIYKRRGADVRIAGSSTLIQSSGYRSRMQVGGYKSLFGLHQHGVDTIFAQALA